MKPGNVSKYIREMESEEIIVSKTNLMTLAIYILGIFGFGFLAYISLTSKITIDGEESNSKVSFLKWIIFFLFCAFTFSSFYNLSKIKIYSLTKKNLIIKHLLFSSKKMIPLTEIKSITRKNIPIKISRGLHNDTNSIEKETSIVLLNGSKITFDSSSMLNYTEFHNAISELI